MSGVMRFLPAGSLRRRVASGVAWSSAATAFQSVAGLAVGIGLARILGATGFGEWGVLNSTIATVGVFAGLGLGTTATKYVAQLRESDPARLGSILVLLDRVVFVSAGSMAAVLFVLAPLVAGPILQASHLDVEFRIACVLLLANALLGVETGVLGGLEAFRQIAVINFVRAVVSVPATVVAGLAFGLAGAVAVTAVLAGGAWVATTVAARAACRRLGIERRGGATNSNELHVLWQFSLPALLSAVMVAPPMWIANVLLVNQPSGYAELGGFTAANQWRLVVTFVPNVVGIAILPILSSLLGHGSPAAPRVLAASIGISALAAAPIALGLSLASAFVMGLSGAEFTRYADVLVIVALTSLIIAAQMPIGSMIAATGRMWLGAAMNLGWSLVFLGAATFLLAIGWGALGLALAYLVAYLIHSLWAFGFAFSYSRGAFPSFGRNTE